MARFYGVNPGTGTDLIKHLMRQIDCSQNASKVDFDKANCKIKLPISLKQKNVDEVPLQNFPLLTLAVLNGPPPYPLVTPP